VWLSAQTFRWIDNEIQNDVDYIIAPAYPGYHEVAVADGIQTYSMFRDVVIYQNSISLGYVGWYMYNVTTKQVYPLAQPYGVPNTVCDRYCYGAWPLVCCCCIFLVLTRACIGHCLVCFRGRRVAFPVSRG